MQAITVEQEKARLRQVIKEGATCACCQQRVQMYRRPITASMIKGLALLLRAKPDVEGFVHVENYLKEAKCDSAIRGDVSKLRFWNFIQPKPGGDPEKPFRGNGYYKILPAARNFISGETTVFSHAKIYNNKFFGFDGDLINVHQVVKKKFDLEKLLKAEL